MNEWRHTTLTILSGATESEELNLEDNGLRLVKTITFLCPTLAEIVNIHFAKTVGGTYYALNDGYGTDIQLQSGAAQILNGITAGAMKLVATGAVAADRTFEIEGAA